MERERREREKEKDCLLFVWWSVENHSTCIRQFPFQIIFASLLKWSRSHSPPISKLGNQQSSINLRYALMTLPQIPFLLPPYLSTLSPHLSLSLLLISLAYQRLNFNTQSETLRAVFSFSCASVMVHSTWSKDNVYVYVSVWPSFILSHTISGIS